MTQVIVTVLYEKNIQLDLSLPWELPVNQLLDPLAAIFKVKRLVDSTLGLIKLTSNNGYISPEETLADANIMFGDFLQLKVYGVPYLFSNSGRRYPIKKGLVVIGRVTPQVSVDIDLTDLDKERVISRQHAVIVHRGDDYFIKDTNSSNGVWVNHRRIDPGKLRKLVNDDLLQLGGIRGVELMFGIQN